MSGPAAPGPAGASGAPPAAPLHLPLDTPPGASPALGPAAERWARVRALFDAAVERPAAERQALVDAAREGDPEVASEVLSLLAAHASAGATAGGFLDASAVDAAARALAARSGGGGADSDWAGAEQRDAAGAPLAGQRLGAYVLEHEVGRGGMGAVYLARRADGQFAQRVAVKVIKRGLDTDALVARFRREREILASLEHPGVARLLDGGAAPDGRPYLVMEYVDGEPLDAHCARRGLDARARLRLFLDVCAAVHFAHQRLVVHRDLKPGNVLVAGGGQVKLLDFGLAQLTDPDRGANGEPAGASTLSGAGLRAMTPEYASPEQVRGGPASTLGDVYSLGVLLYELLAGRRPYGFTSRSPDEVARVVAERAADPLGTSRAPGAPALSRADAAELDVVVATAMHKDPQRRYASAEQLADDVRRFLERRPLRARADGWAYRAGRFVRRNRAGVAAGALVLASLVGGAGLAAWQAGVARRERAVAERRFGEVRRLAGSLLFEVHDAVAPLAGSTPVRELVVKRALEYLDGLTRDGRAVEPALALELSEAYQRVGEIQGNSYHSNLGQTAAAERSYARALALAEQALRAAPGDTAARAAVADAHVGVGDMHVEAGRLAPGRDSYARAEVLRAALLAQYPDDMLRVRSLAAARVRLADVSGVEGYPNLGDLPAARRYLTLAVEGYERAAAATPGDDALQSRFALVLTHRASVAASEGDDSAAVAANHRAVRALETVAGRNPTSAEYRIDLATAYGALRSSLATANLPDSAVAVGRRGVAAFEALRADDPKNAIVTRNLAVALRALSSDLLGLERTAEAVAAARRSFALTEGLLAADPASAERRVDLVTASVRLGDAELAAGEARPALAHFRRGAAVAAALRAADTTDLNLADRLVAAREGVGSAMAALGDAAGGVAELRAALALAERVSARTPNALGRRGRVAWVYADLGAAHKRGGDQAAACAAFGRSMGVWAALAAAGTPRPTSAERVRKKAAAAGCRV